MDVEAVIERCRAMPGAGLEHPFGPQPLVMKIGGRIFAIIAEDADPPSISLKCDPELAPLLRDTYPAVTPGYHLNKRHWNTVALDATVPDDELVSWIEDSYDLVVHKLPRELRQELRKTGGSPGTR